MTNTTVEPDEATRLRNKVVDELRAGGDISSSEIEAVMRKVPRHAFIPDTPLDKAYDTYAAVITKTDEHGVQLSSVSAPQIQAMMLEQAQVKPGMRVLEIGSGGLNAAYLAELVGEHGEVVTVDIDPVVTERAHRLLNEHGYDRVRVLTADAAEPIPELGEVDVVMVTAGAWDIAPAWTAQLKQGGRLVVPLRMRGLTRSVAFTQIPGEHGPYLESVSALICGFVPMQGSTAHREELLLVNGTPEIGLKFDDGLPADPHRLDNVVTYPRHELWTGVVIGLSELIDTLQMAMAISLPGFCTMAVDEDLDTGLVAPVNRRFALAAVEDDTFAYLVTRRTEDNKHIEYGVHALGPNAEQFADQVADVLRDWEASRRGGPSPVIRVYPANTSDDQIPADRVIDKVHSRVSLSWPSA
ncbi:MULTISPECIES: methyltransferase, FxLD system [Streptomyces]|uniref:Protein-L-isoaspartate O-methyltransferase n=1 Tax=Streptomyces griseus subsp. griseus (strain JCM 4626 / CBS 651.72 / NBRC 13350 / KCC S-0626 / ISP 5235) TaxID=455632 RepID=B1VR27_STRGG|nr:methyltransferase, FxLD system [Streptomyces griseus]NEB55568.1 methyltransferase, FxLD system [Streptomyces griseus]BAG20678.1 putative O-methyltransferase [Streptomyces griseus subsp. griseus NBRC 13350]SEE76267.1 protein-L-isoaspartate(D-aspartate) O-methyltransferase [Streptomyces griseus]SQA20456.1 O-methyltransferase [Streptomyces griseus]